MFHSNTELLIDYWRGLRGCDSMPPRAAVDPTGFVALAPRTFISNRRLDGEFELRLAGEAVIDLHGRLLRGETLGHLWRQIHRRRLAGLLEAALASGEPLVIGAEAWSSDASRLNLEILFLPLLGPHGAADRFLGLYQAISGRGRGPAGELAILAAQGVADETNCPPLRLATLNGRQLA